jgi:hypothetical protein
VTGTGNGVSDWLPFGLSREYLVSFQEVLRGDNEATNCRLKDKHGGPRRFWDAVSSPCFNFGNEKLIVVISTLLAMKLI